MRVIVQGEDNFVLVFGLLYSRATVPVGLCMKFKSNPECQRTFNIWWTRPVTGAGILFVRKRTSLAWQVWPFVSRLLKKNQFNFADNNVDLRLTPSQWRSAKLQLEVYINNRCRSCLCQVPGMILDMISPALGISLGKRPKFQTSWS